MRQKIRVFVDGVDFQHELGEAMGGNTVLPSAKEAEEHYPCTKNCGIVEAELTFVRWVKEQDFNDFSNTNKEDTLTKKELHLEHLKKRATYLRSQLHLVKKRIEEVENE